MLVSSREFLQKFPDVESLRRSPQAEVTNVHAIEINATPAEIFSLGLQRLSEIRLHPLHQLLFAVRVMAGKVFGWDRGLVWGRETHWVVGGRVWFFRVEAMVPRREWVLGVENRLTRAISAFLADPLSDATTMLYNLTRADFKGAVGRAYWRMIRPFHDTITEDLLSKLKRRVEGSLLSCPQERRTVVRRK